MKKTTMLLVLALGCGKGGQKMDPTPSEKMVDDHWTPTTPSGKGPAVLNPMDTADGKATRRLTVDQLRDSMPALFGVTWEGQVRGQNVNLFDALSRTLGEADYLQVTAPNVDASPLFAKFMDDMAGVVCARALQADANRPAAERRVIPHAQDVNRNLRFLRLKLHAIHVILADTQNVGQAWLGVCVAMITAPEFMAY